MAILFLRNEVLAGELSSHKETNRGLSSCRTVTVSSIVPQAAQGQWCSVPGCLWNRRAAGPEQEAGDLRWHLHHSMLPLCPQRNSHKWGLDELSREAVILAILKHREIYGGASKWLPTNPLSFKNLKGLFPCFTPFALLPSSYKSRAAIPRASGLGYRYESHPGFHLFFLISIQGLISLPLPSLYCPS